MISAQDIEIWLPVPVPGYEPHYEVSNLGRVRSLRGNRLLKSWKAAQMGYDCIGMQINGVVKRQYIHRLVATAFIGPAPPNHETCHIDGDRRNNNASNLRWGTRHENIKDVDRHNHRPKGETHRLSRLKEEDVISLRAEYKNGHMVKDLALKYGLSRAYAGQVARGIYWAHLLPEKSGQT